MKQAQEAELQDLLEVCKKKKLKLISKFEYSLFDGDIQRVIYVIEKM